MNSSQVDVQTLAARVEKLEATNRRWKLASTLLLVSGVSLFLLGAKYADRIEPDVIHARSVEAQDFVLKDEHGRVFARLTLTPVPGSKLNDQHLYPYKATAALEFYDENGQVVSTTPAKPQFMTVR
jgi:hypothetical protein